MLLLLTIGKAFFIFNLVISLSFSQSDKYLASLGGDDRIVIWDVAQRRGLNGSKATIGSTGDCTCVAFSNTNDTFFVSAGENNIRFWTIDETSKRFTAENMKLDITKRKVTAMSLDAYDSCVYCGTTTGDVLKVHCQQRKLLLTGPRKPIGEGITALTVTPWGDVAVGSGCGKVAILDPSDLHLVSICDLQGNVTSVSVPANTNEEILCGTNQIYCNQCGRMANASSSNKIFTLPEVILESILLIKASLASIS